jgi:competence protein ComEC
MAIVYLSCAWVAGILLGSRFNPPLASLFFGLLPLPLLLIFRQHKKPIILSSLCLVTLVGGAIYFQTSLPTVNENYLQFYNDQGIVELKGIVAQDPDVGDKTTNLHLSAQEIKVSEEWRQVSGMALLTVPRYPAYNYGDVLLVKGKMETPPQLDGFDYQNYLARQETYSIMRYPEVEALATGEGARPLAWIYSLRDRFSQTLARVLPEPQASLAQGIILGIRTNIPASLEDEFVRSGTAHILAISGINLTIVAGILVSLGIWAFGRRRYIYIWVALSIIWLYTLLTGLHPPALRAAIMVSLFLTADFLGRQRSGMIALFLAAAVMVGINPQVLWDASFQMSFGAMGGLIFICPPLQSLGRKAVTATVGEEGTLPRVANVLTDSFSVSLGATLAVWPLTAYYFGVISWVGPLATFLALPVLPAIIVTGVLAGIFGLAFIPLGQAISWLTWLFLSYTMVIVKIFAAIPSSSIETNTLEVSLLVIYYAVLALALWANSQRKRLAELMSKAADFTARLPMKWVVPSLVVIAILVWLAAAAMPDDRLQVNFLNVGQGDAILIQKGTQQILVDGGPSPQAIGLELGKKMPFWDRTIDLVVLTHPEADHLTGLVEVLKRYKVKNVLSANLTGESPLFSEWLSLIETRDIKCTLAQTGQRLDFGPEVTIEVLNPQTSLLTSTASDNNTNSVVLRLTMGRVSFLLTADIGQEVERGLITRRADLNSTVLKVAHHGSDTSTSPEFLAVVTPRIAVISVGQDNNFGLPNQEVMGRLEQKLGSENIYRTDENGTIEFITDGERLWLRLGH